VLAASIHMHSSDTLVTASGMPPAALRAAAVGESWSATVPFLASRPAVQERPVTGKQSLVVKGTPRKGWARARSARSSGHWLRAGRA
jgi:hypothetical protein